MGEHLPLRSLPALNSKTKRETKFIETWTVLSKATLSPASYQEFRNVIGSVTLDAQHVKAGVRKALAEETNSSSIYYRNLKNERKQDWKRVSLWGPQCGGPRNLLPLVPSSSRSSIHDSELIRAISTFCSHGSQWELLQSRQLGARTIVKHQGGALRSCCRRSGFQEARATAFCFRCFQAKVNRATLRVSHLLFLPLMNQTR